MELTQEYFDQALTNLVSKDDFYALKSDIAEIKEKVTRIDKRDLEDSNAFAKDIVNLQDRVSGLERQLKPKHA